MKKYAIIVAGGSGSRMGGKLPKQFMLLKNKPVIYYTLKTFLDSYADIEIILVLPADYIDTGQGIIDSYFAKKNIRIISGGETRFLSVKNGLTLVEQESVIFVHDGVRCLLSKDLIYRCYNKAIESGSAIPAIVSKDSIRLVTDNGNIPYDRNKVMLIQTPQTFHSKILLPAFQIDFKEKFTDEATVVEAFGIKVFMVDGEEKNIKITTPLDLLIAEKVVEDPGFNK